MDERTADGGPTAVDWGWLAVSLPGWRWAPGMLAVNFDGPIRVESVDHGEPGVLRRCRFTEEMVHADIRSGPTPDPDDPATAGCLLALLTPRPEYGRIVAIHPPRTLGGDFSVILDTQWGKVTGRGSTLGRACIAAAEALGRWPGPT